MNNEQLRTALQTEYLHIQNVIEGFDGRIVSIKAWSISFSLVAVGGAFTANAAPVLLVSCISSLLFWFLEASWKTFQTAYYDRAEAIESYFRGECTLQPFQIGNTWYKSWKAGGPSKLRRVLLWPHVAMPHAAIAALALALFVLQLLGAIAI